MARSGTRTIPCVRWILAARSEFVRRNRVDMMERFARENIEWAKKEVLKRLEQSSLLLILRVIQIGRVEALWFYKSRIKKIYNWLANLDFGKIRMGWIKQVIVFIRHNYARYS